MAQEAPITDLLNAWAARSTDREAAAVFELVYARLHAIATERLARHKGRCILQATAVLNEAFLRLATAPGLRWESREHFFAYSSRVMRHVLVDLYKENQRLKRGSGAIHVTLEEPLHGGGESQSDDVVAIHQALEALEAAEPEWAWIVELRYFGGLTPPEVARTLGCSRSTVQRRWRLARAWLLQYLRAQG